MGDPKGFIKIEMKPAGYRPKLERINDFGEVEQTLNEQDRRDQASRCMDCGVPFCQWGCPVMNNMPEWQDAIHRGNWEEAIDILQSTNNFPEFTGRICPAPCEHACTLNIQETPVTIRENEAAAAEKGFENNYIKPVPPDKKTGKRVAVIGSGPAGLACADLLNKWGHDVTVFEKDEKAGGLLRFGIPDFKLNKNVIDRRLDILEKEGLKIKTGIHIGIDYKGSDLLSGNDAVVIAIGAMKPRNLVVPGRNLKGIHFAMDYLAQQNRVISGHEIDPGERIDAREKKVLVIGGGDTGSDCVGTAIRQGAASVRQVEILPKPPEKRQAGNPWPYWANTLRTSSSHEEGCDREWNIKTEEFLGDKDGNVQAVRVTDTRENEPALEERIIEADLVLLSMGFLHCIHEGLCQELGLDLDERGNIKTDVSQSTSKAKVFAAGDAVRGASLVVHAIASGRKVAENVDEYLCRDRS